MNHFVRIKTQYSLIECYFKTQKEAWEYVLNIRNNYKVISYEIKTNKNQ